MPKDDVTSREAALAEAARRFGASSERARRLRRELALAYFQQDLGQDAIELYQRHLSDTIRVYDRGSPQTRVARHDLAEWYRRIDRGDLALFLYQENLATSAPGDDELEAQEDLARAQVDFLHVDDALATYAHLVERTDRVHGVHSPQADRARKLQRWGSDVHEAVRHGRDRPRYPDPLVGPPAPRHAVPISDAPVRSDGLGIDSDVDALARLIAARSTMPPLAIAILAPWGGGKSTFMRLLQERIDNLHTAADEATAEPPYHRSVDVVTFNAWHYSDSHVLVGMVRAIFNSLLDYLQPEPAADEDVDPIRQRMERRQALQATRDRLERIHDALSTDSRIQRPKAFFIALRTLPSILFSSRRPHAVAATVIVILLATLSAGVALWLGLGLPVSEHLREPAKHAATIAAPWATMLVALLGAGRVLYKSIVNAGPILEKVKAGSSWLVSFVAADVETEVKRVKKQLAQAEDEFPASTAVADLETLLNDAGLAAERDSQRGVVGVIQDQLQALDRALGSGANERRLKRIVLHVDDLDRCPPERVIEVLHTINLLQATELFVIVVSADPRWLRRSLQHDPLILPTLPSKAPTRNDDGSSDPLDFLDKIFQIPFALEPMNPGRARRYFSELVTQRDLVDPAIDHPDEPSGTTATSPAVTEVSPPPSAVEVSPKPLTMTPDEAKLLRRLTAMQATPRAIKRFINVYQLLRLTLGPVGPADRSAAAVLLGLVVGAPREGAAVLTKLLDESSDRPLTAIVEDMQREHCASHASTAGAVIGCCDMCQTWRRFLDVLTDPEVSSTTSVESGRFRPWVGVVARFSFYTEAVGLAGVRPDIAQTRPDSVSQP